jgi:hypothetical protein
LLQLQISIACDENVEPLLPHLVQQLTILNSAPAHPLHRRANLNSLGAKNETGRPKAERAGANESNARVVRDRAAS